jgi:CheY-like chemotaxis protein
MNNKIKSILVIDDDDSSLDDIKISIASQLHTNVVTTRHPTKAIQLANTNFFDVVLIDITLNYKGSAFGGLDIYRSLSPRYGNSSLLAYSQFVDDHILERFGEPLNFVEREFKLETWNVVLATEMARLRDNQTCFIAMPFSKEFDAVYLLIKFAVERAGYKPVRVDEQIFTTSIIDKIFLEIRNAKFVIFVATERNPNVFYEAGYALALGKEVVTLADGISELPFDVRARNTIIYHNTKNDFTKSLSGTLEGLTRN